MRRLSALVYFIMNVTVLYWYLFLCWILIVSSDDSKYFINTDGCRIPQFNVSFSDPPTKPSCGRRHVLLRNLAGRAAQFIMLKPYQACCYRYVRRSNEEYFEDRKVRYSWCMPFKNTTVTVLSGDYINVRCTNRDRLVYDDYYALTSRAHFNFEDHPSESSYNVLLIGLDSMSRRRAQASLAETVKYFGKEKWLDFRGYNKVSVSKISNIMAVLTGQSKNLHKTQPCTPDMSECNYNFIWSNYQEAGYVTAYGEDSLYNGVLFRKGHQGFRTQPTHHYMTPIFIASEKKTQDGICSGQIPSGMQILTYILEFTNTYKYKKQFGMFWINSYSRELNQSPKPLDKPLVEFFKRLQTSGVMRNTFVVFFSNNGLRYGKARYPIGSYYDERLPMLYMWVPKSFRRTGKYTNMVENQHRLISPFDLHLTLFDILKISTGLKAWPFTNKCRQCMSLFRHIPEFRECRDAGISEEWCSCHDLQETSVGEYGAKYSLLKIEQFMQNVTMYIPTKACTLCVPWQFKKVLRIHSFSYTKDAKFYLAAIQMNPGGAIFEATVRKTASEETSHYVYDVLSLQLLSPYEHRGYCTVTKYMHFCVCMWNSRCLMNGYDLNGR